MLRGKIHYFGARIFGLCEAEVDRLLIVALSDSSFNRDAEESAERDDHPGHIQPADSDAERVSFEESALAGPRSPPEFAELPLIQWQVVTSELLWVAVKRIQRIHSDSSTITPPSRQTSDSFPGVACQNNCRGRELQSISAAAAGGAAGLGQSEVLRMSRTISPTARPRQTGGNRARILFLMFAGAAVLFVLAYMTLTFGRIQGEEFSPDVFRRREFSYYEIPLLGLQVWPITHTESTGPLENYLATSN